MLLMPRAFGIDMSFSSEVKEEALKKGFTAKKRNSRIDSAVRENDRMRIYETFLKCGSMSHPSKLYLLEFVLQSESEAELLTGSLSSFGIEAKMTERKGNTVVYVQDADAIADILNIIGAHNCLLAFENMRIYKSMRENVQRKVNCETANLSKTVSASVRQTEDIEYLEEHIGFESLPQNLRDVAEMRLAMPGATLQEIADAFVPPIGKSGVNHRLRKLSRLADYYRKIDMGSEESDGSEALSQRTGDKNGQ